MRHLSFIFLLISTIGWSQSLGDLQKLAAEQNPGLQAKYKSFEAAMQQTAQVSALPDPTLSFGYFISPIQTRVGPQRANFSLTQMFPWFGTFKALEKSSALNAEAKYQAFLAAKEKLFYQVAATYFPLYELERWIQLEAENIVILESYKTLANTKFANGKGAMTDVLRVNIMMNDAQTNLEILNQKKQPLLAQLNQLLNQPDSMNIEVSASLAADIPEELIRENELLNHPLLTELETKAAASQARERAAHLQGLPKIGAGVNYIIVNNRTDASVPQNGKDALLPTMSVSLPIFRKKYHAAEKEATLMTESYQLQKQDLTNQLHSQLDMATFRLYQQKKLIELYDQQIQSTQQTLDLLLAAYSNSGADYEEVLRMQQQLLKYQKMKATAEADFQTALAEIDYLIN